MNRQNELGRQIRNARLQAGLTQTDLGERLGLEQSSVSDIENGNTKVGVLDFLRIASTTGKPPSFFLPELSMAASAPYEEEAIALLRSMTPRSRELALEALRAQARLDARFERERAQEHP